MAKKHHYIFMYAPGHWRNGSGSTVGEACKEAFGVVYGPESGVKYKDLGTRSPAHLTAKAKQEIYNGPGWLDIPSPTGGRRKVPAPVPVCDRPVLGPATVPSARVKPTRKIDQALADLVERLGLDSVVYQLTEYAWRERDNAEDDPANEAYWQKTGEILADCQERLEAID